MTNAGGGHAPDTGRMRASKTLQTSSVPPEVEMTSIASPFQFSIVGR
jgi:hypothetical protein